VARVTGETSRKGKPFTAIPHITEALAPIFAKYPDLVLDGEIYTDKFAKDFETICSIVRKLKPTTEEIEFAKQAEYHIYDVPSMTENFSERAAFYKEIIEELNNPYIKIVETRPISTSEELDAFYEELLEAGYEGQMVRTDTPYEWSRTDALLKRKVFITDEFILTGIIEGVGNLSGKAGNVTLAKLDGTPIIAKNGKPAKAGIKGSWAFAKRLLEQADTLIGQQVTVEFLRYNSTGAPYLPKLVAIRDYE
jgi:DNA ligase-1